MPSNATQYEFLIADTLNLFDNVTAERPVVSTKYSDVKVSYNNNTSWLEVKMKTVDNLGNPRVSWLDNIWTFSGSSDPIKDFSVEYLTNDQTAQEFLYDISNFSNIPYDIMDLPSTKGELNSNPNAVSYDTMREFFNDKEQYILQVENVDLGSLVTDYYLLGKSEPVYYMQAGDNFYKIGNTNPLQLPDDIPELSGNGTFKVRIGIRSEKSRYYEIQPEIKIKQMPNSDYSIKPGSDKEIPFK